MSGERHLKLSDLHPLHFAILKALPIEGSVLGYHKLAKTAKQLTGELNDDLPTDPAVPELNTKEVTGALRALHVANFVTNTKLTGGGLGWQATPKGKDTLSKDTS